MACYHPLKGWRSKQLNASGSRSIVFNVKDGFSDMTVVLPCGQCIGCRLERSRVWAVRCVHEASLYDANCFITLTYDDNWVPEGRSLVLKHFQDFMKRLRKKFGSGIRFFHCGEYGEQFGRPHYHACLFNFDFPDKVFWRVSAGKDADRLYRSPALEALWPYGHSSCGEVTFKSAAYVARYVMKKVNGEVAQAHYEYVDPETGEVFDRHPEYTTMSRRPGIGRGWMDKYTTDVYPSDFIILNGKKFRPPRFYDNVFEVNFPSDLRLIKGKRKRKALVHAANNTPDRLKVRESISKAKLGLLKRGVD